MNFIGLGIACIAMGLAAIAEGMAVSKAMDSIGRNPTSAKDVRTTMIVGVALIETVLMLGIVLILSAVNVYIQDTEYIISFVLNMLFYGTPIIYQLSQFSDAGLLYKLVSINPMTQIINGYRDIFLYHVVPNMHNLFLVLILGLVVLVVGFIVFRKLEKGFAEEL